MPAVTVVIPTLRARDRLPRCVDALRAQTRRDFEIVVIDNASTDGTAAWLAAQTDVRAIRNEHNNGFATACNQGIRASTTPFVALINDDAFAEPNWLEALLNAATHDQADNVGAWSSLMLFDHDPTMVQSAGICMDRAGIAWDRFGGHLANAPEIGSAMQIFGASGGAALYRQSMLDQIGLFDERFFAYLEDVDLAWRAQRTGWGCTYVPGARVRHQTSATSVAGSPFKNKLLGRNKLWMCAKNAPMTDWPVIALYDALAVAWAGVSRREWSHAAGRFEAVKRLREFRSDYLSASKRVPFARLAWPWNVPARMSGPA